MNADAMQSSRPSLVLPLYYVYAPTPLNPPHSLSSRPVVHSLFLYHRRSFLLSSSLYILFLFLPSWLGFHSQSKRFEEDFRYFPLGLRGS